jgi:hypothetical protein
MVKSLRWRYLSWHCTELKLNTTVVARVINTAKFSAYIMTHLRIVKDAQEFAFANSSKSCHKTLRRMSVS